MQNYWDNERTKIFYFIFFFYLGFLSRTFTNHKTAGEGRGHLTTTSTRSQTLKYQPGDYCRELTSAHSQQPESNREPLVSERKSLTTKLCYQYISYNFKGNQSLSKKCSNNQAFQACIFSYLRQKSSAFRHFSRNEQYITKLQKNHHICKLFLEQRPNFVKMVKLFLRKKQFSPYIFKLDLLSTDKVPQINLQ